MKEEERRGGSDFLQNQGILILCMVPCVNYDVGDIDKDNNEGDNDHYDIDDDAHKVE